VRVAHIFAGAGGGILASEILGHMSVLAVEKDPDRCSILRHHADTGWFPGLEVLCDDVRTVNVSPWEGQVDCVTAGFPCQDISAAGRGAGVRGKRSGLIFEMFAQVVDRLQPKFIFLENSPRIRLKGRREIIEALLARGYSWRDGTLAASHVGAPHIRNRWWLLAANADGQGKLQEEGFPSNWRGWLGDGSKEVPPDLVCDGLQVPIQQEGLDDAEQAAVEATTRYTQAHDWPSPDSGICGVVHGLAGRVHISRQARIAALGDAQVPLQAALAWMLLVSKGIR